MVRILTCASGRIYSVLLRGELARLDVLRLDILRAQRYNVEGFLTVLGNLGNWTEASDLPLREDALHELHEGFCLRLLFVCIQFLIFWGHLVRLFLESIVKVHDDLNLGLWHITDLNIWWRLHEADLRHLARLVS